MSSDTNELDRTTDEYLAGINKCDCKCGIVLSETGCPMCDPYHDNSYALINNAQVKLIISQKEAEARKQQLDSLIDEEVKLYKIYHDDNKICVGIKIMADAVREKYDE